MLDGDDAGRREYAGCTWNRLTQVIDDEVVVRQEFADDCDINRIVDRFMVTGAIDHVARFSPTFFDAGACDYQSVQNLLLRAREAFEGLPVSVKRVVASPAGFLAWIEDPANAEDVARFGLGVLPKVDEAKDSGGAESGAAS